MTTASHSNVASSDAVAAYAEAVIVHMVEFFGIALGEADRRVKALRKLDPGNIWMHEDAFTLAGRLSGLSNKEIRDASGQHRERSEWIWAVVRSRHEKEPVMEGTEPLRSDWLKILLSPGRSTQQIADELGISVTSISAALRKNHSSLAHPDSPEAIAYD